MTSPTPEATTGGESPHERGMGWFWWMATAAALWWGIVALALPRIPISEDEARAQPALRQRAKRVRRITRAWFGNTVTHVRFYRGDNADIYLDPELMKRIRL